MDYKLEGKVAIVTGASSGIGEAVAKMFVHEGASVMLTARREDILKRLKMSLGGTSTYLAGDMLDETFYQRIVEETKRCFGKVDILVCSAGIALRTPTLKMQGEEWRKVMDINLTAPMLLSQACINCFKEQGNGGKIVYVSSTAGKNVNLGASPSYGASKAGILYLTRHLAKEFVGDKIYVNAVCPGPVNTEITKTWTDEYRASVIANLPMGRMGTPEEIANLILFLSSPISDYITGESVLINGGRYME